MKTVELEYGDGMLEARLPDGADVFIPGETVPDPPFLEDPAAATRESILNPVGMPPIAELVKKGSKVTIIFPDIVKGGFQDNSHRKVAIPIVIGECLKAGVEKCDIRLICSNGLHRKNTREEIRGLLGDGVFDEHRRRIVNHDSEDRENLVDLGTDELGDRVVMNREVFESELAVMIGHTLGNPYGGYSGGYKHCATGITNWECIASHHVPDVMHRDDFTPASTRSLMRRKMDAIGRHMEGRMGGRFFACDAVLDTFQRQIAVFSGCAKDIQPLSWQVADRRTCVPWAGKKYDVMMFGMPRKFHYGDGHGTNPILMLQAIAANVVRHKRVLRDGCVVICSSICDGYFNDEHFPSYRPLYELFCHKAALQRFGSSTPGERRHCPSAPLKRALLTEDSADTLPDLAKYAERFARDPEYVEKYRFAGAYHPFHAFSMIACGHIARMHCAAIYIVGAREPGYARGMGMETRATFAEALADAERHVGTAPAILALPRTFKCAGVHLMMKGS